MSRVVELDVGGGAWRVTVHGRPTARPPLVLLHGFMGSAASWSPLAERLALHREVIVPDLPGHGGSAAPATTAGYAVERVAEGAAGVVARLAAGEADWLGYSMGGRILLAGVAEGAIRPRRLILESASPGLESAAERRQRRTADERLARRLEQGGMAPFVDDWLRRPLFASLPADARARARAERLANRPQALAAALIGGGTGSQRSYWPDLAGVLAPTLLLTGDLDRKFVGVARRMAASLPRTSWSSLADVGHAVHLEAPEPWLAVVEGWLSRNHPDG